MGSEAWKMDWYFINFSPKVSNFMLLRILLLRDNYKVIYIYLCYLDIHYLEKNNYTSWSSIKKHFQAYRCPLQVEKNVSMLFKNYISTHMYSSSMLKSVSLALNAAFVGLWGFFFLEWKIPMKCIKRAVLAFELFSPSY